MKIAVIGVKGIPAKQGGIEHYCQELYSEIASQDHTIDLYARSSYTQAKVLTSYKCHGVRVISLPSLAITGLDAFFNSFLATICAVIIKYDIVHFHALGPSFFCWLPRLLTSAKIVVTCHGLDWQRAKWSKLGSYIIRAGERLAVANADEVIVVSQYLQAYFKEQYNLHTVYIPTAPAKYSELNPTQSYIDSLGLETERYIIFLGRLVPEKRPDLLIEAFKLLNPLGWKLALVGDASGTNDFKLKLTSNRSNKIIFTNLLTGSHLTEIVRKAGLLVLPSELEGFPLVLLEAMREGVPILASDIPPHRQIIGLDESRGSLFKVGDLQSLISNLEKALSHPKEMKNKAQKAQVFIDANYNWKKVSYENMVLYGKISNFLTKKQQNQEAKKNIDEIEVDIDK